MLASLSSAAACAALAPRHGRASLLRPVAAAALALCQGLACAQAQAEGPGLRPRTGDGMGGGGGLRLLPSVPGGDDGPVVIEADRLYGRPELETVAEGKVEFSRGPLTMRADRIEYRWPTDTARATGDVEISRDGNTYRGPEVQLEVERFRGYFLSPSYYFERTQSGGSAERFDFLDEYRGVATGATYTSCPAPDPAWILSTDRVTLDTATDTGVAEGAVLRFYGVPILAAPTLSFPLSEARKSGWLPPSIGLSSKSGFELAAPYYWNIAPNRDATFTPTVMSRRGAGLGTEFRYLEPAFQGLAQAFVLPDDRVANRSRWSLNFEHEARWAGRRVGDIDYGAQLQRASDDDYWKDFSERLPSLTPRLLPSSAYATRRIGAGWGDTLAYANVQHWQVLQEREPGAFIIAPYQREPQVGLRQRGARGGFEWTWETEANRFTNDNEALVEGARLHALGSISRPWWPLGVPGWTVTPRVSLNTATYDIDPPSGDAGFGGDRSASRTVPSASLDSAWVFERETAAFGRELTQTLEPRLFYVNTPFVDQSDLPNFDSAAKDFNFTSIYSDNVFSGIDRVSDANQLTAGVTTRFLDRRTGTEALRLGVAQRLLLRTQRITPDGEPITERLSDLLLLGATNVIPDWWLDGIVQYSPEIDRTVRSNLGVRYSPGPFRTIGATYRYTRNASEQLEVGWQWPVNEAARRHAAAALLREAEQRDAVAGLGTAAGRGTAPANDCNGAWYTVGRVNYSRRDSRITDSLIGFEYDSGCWIGRMVVERLSTGRSEATTRLMFQLELVGLSRLGSNPLGVLRENIPGYRLLRDDAPVVAPALSIP